MKELKFFGSLLIIALFVPTIIASDDLHQLQPNFEKSLNGQRDEGSIWFVHITEWTEFIFENNPNIEFGIDDLEPGMFVSIEGDPVVGTNHFFAYIVFVHCGDRGNSGDSNGNRPGHLIGNVEYVDHQNNSFEIATYQCPGFMTNVFFDQNTLFLDAPVGQEIYPIDIWEINPGDPIMVHGMKIEEQGMENNIYAEVVVRTFDWDGDQEYMRTDLELFGFMANMQPARPRTMPNCNDPVDMFPMEVEYTSNDSDFSNYVKEIGSEGGIFHFPWGHLEFPPGALSETLTIRVNSEFLFWDTMINVYFFQPHDTHFNEPVELEIRYFNLDDINPDRVFLTYYDEDQQKWIIAGHMDHHPEEHCFRGYIEHFSRYSLSTNQRPIQQQLEQH